MRLYFPAGARLHRSQSTSCHHYRQPQNLQCQLDWDQQLRFQTRQAIRAASWSSLIWGNIPYTVLPASAKSSYFCLPTLSNTASVTVTTIPSALRWVQQQVLPIACCAPNQVLRDFCTGAEVTDLYFICLGKLSGAHRRCNPRAQNGEGI